MGDRSNPVQDRRGHGRVSRVAQELLQGDHSLLHCDRAAAVVGGGYFDPRVIRLGSVNLELLRTYGLTGALVVFHVISRASNLRKA